MIEDFSVKALAIAGDHGYLAMPYIKKVIVADSHGFISDYALLFLEALHEKIDLHAIEPAMQANLFTWLAYTIIDSLSDNESHPAHSDTVLSDLSTLYKTEALKLYQEISPESTLPRRLFSRTDKAISLEVRLRKSTQLQTEQTLEALLSEKSAAHNTGALLLSEKTPTIEKVLSLVCAIRQLNDDLLDWKEDFENHEVTYVTFALITLSPPKPSLKGLELTFLRRGAQQLLEKLLEYHEALFALLKELSISPSSLFVIKFIQPSYDNTVLSLEELKRLHGELYGQPSPLQPPAA